jgi:hypothetical protein
MISLESALMVSHFHQSLALRRTQADCAISQGCADGLQGTGQCSDLGTRQVDVS